jgi:hypothetical protein
VKGDEKPVTQNSSPPPWFRCASECYFKEPRKRIGLLPPLSSFSTPDLRVFNSSNDFVSYPTESSSLALARHLGVLSFHKPLSYLGNMSTTSLVRKAPRCHSSALQHIKNQKPFFCTLGFPKASRRMVPSPREVTPAGFGYPLGVFLPSDSLEASFSSRRSWASPFKALLLTRDRKKVSLLLSAPALGPKT